MRKITFFTFLFVLLFSFSFIYEAQAGGFRYWNYQNVSWQMNKSWRTDFEEEMRFDANGRGFYYEHSDFGIINTGLAKWFEIGPYFRFIEEKRLNKRWKYEIRPHADAKVKWTFLGFAFSTRSRFEYRDREDMRANWQYRNRFEIKPPFKWTRYEIQPFIAEEIYVNINRKAIDRNWLSGGLSYKIVKNLGGEIFYLWETEKPGTQWTSHNVFATRLKLSF